MFGNLKSLVDKNKQNKAATIGGGSSALGAIARPLMPSAAAPKPTTTPTSADVTPAPSTTVPTVAQQPKEIPPPTAPLGDLLFARLLYIDECLLSFAKDADAFNAKEAEKKKVLLAAANAADASSGGAAPNNKPAANERLRLLYTTPSEAEARVLADTYAHAKAVRDADEAIRAQAGEEAAKEAAAAATADGEPAEKKLRTEGTTVATTTPLESAATTTTTTVPEVGESPMAAGTTRVANIIADLMATTASASNNATAAAGMPTPPIADLLRALFSMNAIIDKAAAAESDAQSLNAAITQQGQQDEAVAQAVMVATQKALLAAEMSYNNATTSTSSATPTTFEVAGQPETTIAAVLASLAAAADASATSSAAMVNLEAIGGNANNLPIPPAAHLITASNLYTCLMLVVERSSLLREVIAYQHRWLVAEGRRIASLRSNSLIVSRYHNDGTNDPWPTSSNYTKAVKEALKQVNSALLKGLKADAAAGGFVEDTSSSANTAASSSSSTTNTISTIIANAYKTIFAVPSAARTAGTTMVTPHMLLAAVKTPTNEGDEWVMGVLKGGSDVCKKEATTAPLPLSSLFPASDVYRQMMQASKGDLRARLQVIIDTLEGFGRVVDSLQRDAHAIMAVTANENNSAAPNAAEGTTPTPTSYSAIINLFPNTNYQRQQLIDGKLSLAMPEKLRTVLVTIGVQLAITLVNTRNAVADVNHLTALAIQINAATNGLANPLTSLTPQVAEKLSSLRSAITQRTLAAEDVYFSYTIGNEKWSMGIVGDSLHMRRSLEKIQNLRVAHVMNNVVVQGAMLALKRLITFVGTECGLEARVK